MTNIIYWPALDGTLKGNLVNLVQATTEPVIISCLKLDASAYDLSAYTVTCKRKNVSTKEVATLTGTITPGNGTLTWTPSSADLGEAGTFRLLFTAVNGSVTNKSYPVELVVIEDPSTTTVVSDPDVGVSAAEAAWLTNAVAGSVIMEPLGAQAYERGKLYYSTVNETLQFFNNDSAVELQIGQENWIRVYNDTGSTITNGSVVYNSGNEAVEDRMTIALALADAAATSRVLGIATHDIETGSFGFVTQFGYVGGLDTSAFSNNTPIWLSATVAGGYTDTEPESPNISIFLGFVVQSDATAGNLFITALGNTTSGAVTAGDSTQVTVPARKSSVGTITKGQVVYIAGYNTGQGVVTVELADSDSSATMPALGVANATITNSSTGDVVVLGRVANIDTSAYSVNQSLYVSGTAGAMTSTKPTGTGLIQKVANVLRSNVSNGVIQVVGAGRTNDVPNFSAVNKFYASDSAAATADEKDITDFALSLLDDADAATARATLGAGADGIIYNVLVYGATGDSVTDDSTAILAAIAAAKAAGGGVVYFPSGTYLISQSLVLASNVELRGAGYSSKITKAASVKSLLTVNAAAGATSVTVADSTGFAVGEAIHLYDTSSYEWLSTQSLVTDVTGNVITFADTLDGALQTTRSAAATTSFPLIRNEEASVNVVVRDLLLDQNSNSNDPADDFTLAIIHWVETYYSLVENCTLLNACGDAYSDQAQDGTGITPAANLIITTKNTIKGCKIRSAGRHGVHLGTCIRGGYILSNDIVDCPAGFGYFYCAYATETIAANNRMENCFSGFAGIDERDYDNIIVGNVTKNMGAGYAVEINSSTASGGRIIVVGNQFLCDATASGDNKTGRVYLNLPDCVFQGNTINMAAKAGEGLRIGASATRALVSGNKIIGSSGAGGTTGCQIDAVSDVRFIGNSIYNFSKAVSVRGATRLIANNNQLTPISTCWNFEVTTSTDCVIKNERTTFATPVTETVAATRLIYENIGTNGTSDPASAGDWNAVSGRRFDGTLVRWDSGGGEKISIFYNGVGWTALN